MLSGFVFGLICLAITASAVLIVLVLSSPTAAVFDDRLGPVITCPECGERAPLQHYDVGGADEGNLFCNACHSEISAES